MNMINLFWFLLSIHLLGGASHPTTGHNATYRAGTQKTGANVTYDSGPGHPLVAKNIEHMKGEINAKYQIEASQLTRRRE